MDEHKEVQTVVAQFVKDALALPDTKKDPAMVAAIAELIKQYWLL